MGVGRTLACALLLAAVGAAAEVDVTFGSPAYIDDAATVHGATWAVLIFEDGGDAALDLDIQGEWRETRYLTASSHVWAQPIADTQDIPPPVTVEETTIHHDETLAAILEMQAGGRRAIILHGPELVVHMDETTGAVHAAGPAVCSSAGLAPPELDGESVRAVGQICPSNYHSITRFEPGDGGWTVGLTAERLTSVEWHNATLDCQRGPCPDAAAWQRDRVAVGDVSYQVDERHFTQVRGDISLAGTLQPTAVIVGGLQLSFEVEGSIRLPQAEGSFGCDATLCYGDDATLRATGDLVLSDLRTPEPDGRMQARVGGDVASARLDETWIPTDVFTGRAGALAAGAVATVGLALAWKLLGALLSHPAPEDALRHERRQRLYDYIVDHPGTNFREMLRETEIPAGTARHHLNILRRSGLIVEHPHRATLRFFENHGKFDKTWNAVVLLREPALQRVHDLVAKKPGVMQKDILDITEGWGWSRSTTQHRLERLLKDKVLEVKRSGRCA